MVAIGAAALASSCTRVTERLWLPDVDAGASGLPAPPPAAAPAAPDVVPTALPPAEWNCGPRCFRDPGVAALPPPADRFAGLPEASADVRPVIAYPLAGSLHPINVADLSVHFRRHPGVAQTIFRLRFQRAAGGQAGGEGYDFFVPCTPPVDAPLPPAQDECVYALPVGAWLDLATALRGQAATLTVAATDGAGGSVATSAPLPLAFSPGAVEGGLYYWSTGLQGTYRLLFGARKAKPFIVPNSATNRFECGGCHAVSRDGRVIAFAAEQAGHLTVALTDAPDRPTIRPPSPPVTDGHVLSLNRDGSLVLVSYGKDGDNGRIAVRETATGREVARLDPAVLGTPERRVYFPEWSPDGREIVATLASGDERPWSVTNGYLVVIPYDDGRFGAARVIVPKEPALSHFYPTWSPDGRYVAFASAPTMGRSYDNPNARLRLVARDGGRVFELGRATQGIGKTSTWPKFTPFVQGRGRILFLTFNSKMDYGFVLKNSRAPQGGWPQLWLSAIDLDELDAGDPSSAPIWLPFQEVTQRNHLGHWTERVVCRAGAATTGGCGENERCDQGQCVRVIP